MTANSTALSTTSCTIRLKPDWCKTGKNGVGVGNASETVQQAASLSKVSAKRPIVRRASFDKLAACRTKNQQNSMANIQGIVKSIRDIMWQDSGLNGDAQRIEQLGWMLFFKIFSDKDKDLEEFSDHYKSPIPGELHWDKWAGNDEGMTGDELLEFVDRKLFPSLRNLEVTGNKRALIVREVFAGNNN